MRKMLHALITVAALLCTEEAIAQTKPDFSGRWLLPVEAGRGAGAAGGGQRGGGGGGGGGGATVGRGAGGGAAVGGAATAGGAAAGAAVAAGGAAAGGGAAVGGGAPRGGGQGGARGGRGPDLGTGWGPDITIAQDASKLTLTYAFFGRGDMQPPIKLVYNLDGSESKNIVMMGRGMQELSSKAVWDGDKLVITTIYNIQDPSAPGGQIRSDTKQTLFLESPTMLLVETVRAGVMGGAATTTQTRYTK